MYARTQLSRNITLDADETLANVPAIPLQVGGELGVHVYITNGAGIAPTDSPVGVWEIYLSCDGQNYYRYASTAITAELANCAATGNNLINAWSVFSQLPGTSAKVIYNATSGGLTSATAFVQLSA